MPDDQMDWPWPVKPDDLYHILIDTRNLEVNLFWQRSNYFLVLNSAIVLAFFNLKDQLIYVRIFAVLGFLASLLWFAACLASKYWQTLWQQRLAVFEKEHLPGLEFFSASSEWRKELVANGLKDEGLGPIENFIYCGLAKRGRSVSFSMLLLAVVFILAWLALFVTSFLTPRTI